MSLTQDVAAEVRAEMARRKLSGVRAAKALGWTQYYISVRLRGAVPFGLADLEAIAGLLDVPVTRFIAADPVRDFYSKAELAGQRRDSWAVAA